jgi:hypothetical protein
VGAKVTEVRRSQERVAGGMNYDITVRLAGQPHGLIRPVKPGEPHRPVFRERVDVHPCPNPRHPE